MSARDRAITAFVVSFLLVLGTSVAAGGIIYVDAGAGGSNTGTTWTNAFNFLQDALAVAEYGDEIWVAQGIYQPDRNSADPCGPVGTGDREATFQLVSGTELYGGFPAGGGDWEDRNPGQYETLLSGDLAGNDVALVDPWDLADDPCRGENSFHVVNGSETDANTVLDGVTVAHGNANALTPELHQKGGGMFNNYNGSQSRVTVNNCVFRDNSATWGGGMYNTDATLVVTNCTFSGNAALNYGGGVRNYNFGGGSSKVGNCTFRGNVSYYGGGMANISWASPDLVNCVFTGNSATGMGGGMFNLYPESNPITTNCTFSGNWAKLKGGAIAASGASVTLNNCILWSNSVDPCMLGPQMAGMGNATGEFTINYSDIEGGLADIDVIQGAFVTWGPGNIDQDPCFVDADGGDDIPGTADDNVRLLPGSACLDAADNTRVPGDSMDLDGDGDTDEQVPVDHEGKLRFVDDPDAPDSGSGAAPIVDMGAYERAVCGDQAHLPPLGDIDNDCFVNLWDYSTVAKQMSNTCTGPDWCGGADVNEDGKVDLLDILIQANNWVKCTAPECD